LKRLAVIVACYAKKFRQQAPYASGESLPPVLLGFLQGTIWITIALVVSPVESVHGQEHIAPDEGDDFRDQPAQGNLLCA
jgi:hypothetical protein